MTDLENREPEVEAELRSDSPSWPAILALLIVCLTVVSLCYIVRVTS